MVSNHNIYKLLSLCLSKAKLLKCFVRQMISASFLRSLLFLCHWEGRQGSPVPKEVLPGAEPLAPRCRTLCSSVPEKCLVQKAFGVGDGKIAGRAHPFPHPVPAVAVESLRLFLFGKPNDSGLAYYMVFRYEAKQAGV